MNKLDIKIGDIVFSRGDGWFEKLIRFGTRSDINHVGIVYEIHPDKVVVAESLPEGFVLSEYHNNYITDSCEVRRAFKKTSREKEQLTQEIIESKLGRPYDWMSIIRIALKILTLGIYKRKVDTEEAMICSEAVARILSRLGYKPVDKLYDYVTPQDLRISIPVVIVPLLE